MPTITICRELRAGYSTRRALAARLNNFSEAVTLPQKIAEIAVPGDTTIAVKPDHLSLFIPYLELPSSKNHAAALFAAGVINIATNPGDQINYCEEVKKLLATSATASIKELRQNGLKVKLQGPPVFPEILFLRLVTAGVRSVREASSFIGQTVEAMGTIIGFCGAGKLGESLPNLFSGGYARLNGIVAVLTLAAGAVYGYYAGLLITNTAAFLSRLARFPGDVRTYTIHSFGGKVSQKRLEGIQARLDTTKY
jgi:hypothetical protein